MPFFSGAVSTIYLDDAGRSHGVACQCPFFRAPFQLYNGMNGTGSDAWKVSMPFFSGAVSTREDRKRRQVLAEVSMPFFSGAVSTYITNSTRRFG